MNKNLNNKGFTLIELLAVFVILIAISFVAIGGIMDSLDRREVKECEEQQELAVSAAKMYFSLDGTDIEGDEVELSNLVNGGYFKDEYEGSSEDILDDKITIYNVKLSDLISRGYFPDDKKLDRLETVSDEIIMYIYESKDDAGYLYGIFDTENGIYTYDNAGDSCN